MGVSDPSDASPEGQGGGVHLPSPNMDRALCVLNQQCCKLKGEPDDIKAVQKSFGKLFDCGLTKFLKDNPKDIQNKFINIGYLGGLCIIPSEIQLQCE